MVVRRKAPASLEGRSFYVGVVLVTSHSDLEGFIPLYEERLYLLSGTSLEAAWEAGQLLVSGDLETSYLAASGEVVTWSSTLVAVGPVVDDSFSEGSELFSRFFWNVTAYKQLKFEDFAEDR